MTPAPPTSSRLMAVMFTDIARSVDIKCRIGDADYARLIQRHDELFRAALAQVAGAGGGGEILQDAGDGFLARFDTPSDAVNAALQFQHAVCTQPWPGERPRIRIGLHAGEVAARNAPTDIARALQHHDHAITAARASAALGPDHPTTAMALLRRAQFHADHADSPAAAADLLAAEPALSRLAPRHHLVTQAATLRAAIGTPAPTTPDKPDAPRS